MPPRIKKTLAISTANLRGSTKTKLKKMQKPKKINKKLRDRVFDARCLHRDMEEAVRAAHAAAWKGDHDQVDRRLDQIQLDLEH